eukprot:CAMPEP_0185847728 /NCGR_PEP_ID=MMETSP1354-20130828/2893_1 /TAXON_ID=708628 /ORGANISM="Erythrolobus madagascarensis, Strain CCMP3276" /LENGTH=210 /DNA_ID=CAMNT_0028548057 /DNA_START=390 /DNA_END=1018 /DNA_ORIENTATION=-
MSMIPFCEDDAAFWGWNQLRKPHIPDSNNLCGVDSALIDPMLEFVEVQRRQWRCTRLFNDHFRHSFLDRTLPSFEPRMNGSAMALPTVSTPARSPLAPAASTKPHRWFVRARVRFQIAQNIVLPHANFMKRARGHHKRSSYPFASSKQPCIRKSTRTSRRRCNVHHMSSATATTLRNCNQLRRVFPIASPENPAQSTRAPASTCYLTSAR